MNNKTLIIFIIAFGILLVAIGYGIRFFISSESDLPNTLETMEVKVYFMNNNLDKEITCEKVFPVIRQIAKTPAIASATIAELLKGPTVAESASGYMTTINSGVKVQKISQDSDVIKVDFDQTLEKNVAGSCKVAAIRAQIIETIKQIESVNEVIISVDGRVDDVLQP